MKNEFENLKNEFEKVLRQNCVLTESFEELRAENKKLNERIDYLIRQLFGSKSEKIDPNQLMLILGMDEMPPADDPEDEPPPSAPPHPKRKRRQIKDRLPKDLPVRTTFIDPPEVNAAPEDYRCIGEEAHSELSMTQPVYFLNKTVRRKYVKKDDRSQPPIIVPAEPRLIENSFASPELLVDIVLKKYTEHLPLYRQADILNRRHGIEISRKTMSGWMWHVGNWLRIIYEEMKAEVRNSGYLQADETCIKYIDPGTGRARSGYLWVYHAPNVGVIFEWHQGRGTEHLKSMLLDFTGDLQSDGYRPYRTFNLLAEKTEPYTIYACWAHARRKFFDAKADSPAANVILKQIQSLYQIEKDLRNSNASHDERYARRKESRSILDDIRESLHQGLLSHRPQSLTGRAISYTMNLWDELVRYADTGHVEIDNNLVENAIRPTAIGKKNWMFFGSPDSGWQSAVIYSVLETCRKLGINQQEYLYDVLTQLPKLKAQEAKQLTPLRWMEKRAKAVA